MKKPKPPIKNYLVKFINKFTDKTYEVELKDHTTEDLLKKFKKNYLKCEILELYSFIDGIKISLKSSLKPKI